MRPTPLLVLSLSLAGCAQSPPSKDASAEPAPSAVTFSSHAPASTAQPPAPVPPPSSVATTAASAAPHADASAAPSTEASAAPPAPPKVRVTNIGMHIGGGPDANEDANKAPIRESVAPHFDEFRRCWGALDDPKAKGTYGVDLLIPREGGKPKSVDKVRTSLKGAPFKECMSKAFEAIDFKRPRTGLTKVSYSLRFGD